MLTQPYLVLGEEDMIRLKYPSHSLTGKPVFPACSYVQAISHKLGIRDVSSTTYQWFEYGVEAQLLQVENSISSWQNGQIRFCIAFQPSSAEQKYNSNSRVIIPHEDDVFDLNDNDAALVNLDTTTIKLLHDQIRQSMGVSDAGNVKFYWFDDRGIECEVLRVSGDVSGWQPGVARIQFEFILGNKTQGPENSVVQTSGLDSLRQSQNVEG